MSKNKLTLLALGIGIFLLSTGLSYIVFSPGGSSFNLGLSSSKTPPTPTKATGNNYDALEFDQNQPKTEACPLTGVLYSKQQANWWQTHEPLGVMIENHTEARPQSGISFADVTYEAVAEGGITRTLNIYYCQDAGRIGPVRSARTYFLDMVSEYGPFPLYAHVGGANCDESTGSGCQNGAKADALGQIEKYKWYGKNDLSGGFSIGTPQFKRLDIGGENIATEHTMYSNTNLLWDFAKKNRKITNVDENGKAWDTGFTYYPFEKDAPSGDRPTSQIVSFDYWSSMSGYDVQWTYNPADNLYYRKNGGAVHNDRNTGKQLTAKNVVLLFMKESHAHDGYENDQHLLYGDIGTGNATVFMNGKQIKATWKKANRTAHLQLLDTSGKEISLTAGKLWFHILPLDTDVTVK
jgi:uncharacterized protein YneR